MNCAVTINGATSTTMTVEADSYTEAAATAVRDFGHRLLRGDHGSIGVVHLFLAVPVDWDEDERKLALVVVRKDEPDA